MGLSSDLISQFVKITKDDKKVEKETTVFGTTVEYDGSIGVKIDGSELITPVSTTADTKANERVTVMIKNHTATITGNITSPAARSGTVIDTIDTVEELSDVITEFEIAIGDKVSTKDLDTERGRIDELLATTVNIEDRLTSAEADISTLETDNLTVKEKITAAEGDITKLKTDKLDVITANAQFATIENLESTNAKVDNLEATNGEFVSTITSRLTATEADIAELEANKLSAKDIEGKYANIDFSNIDKATMAWFYANSGLINNVVVGDGTITGELVGVTIKGDLIEGNTIKADKLVIKGTDGLYYKLNTNGVTTEAEQTNQNSLSGSVIMTKSITATKIDVEDLVAFEATIGGFNITNNSIYSGTKASSDNTTRGIYLDSDGQMVIGDASNFIKYYKDADGSYKLIISAANVIFATTNKSVESTIDDISETLSVSGRNLIVRRDELVNTYVVASGQVVECETNYYSSTMLDPIRVEPGETYTFSKAEVASQLYFRWAWYDKDMNVIGRTTDSAMTFSWTAPENAYYVVVSYPHVEGANPKMEKGTEVTAYTPAIEDFADTINTVESRLNASIDGVSDELHTELNDLEIGGRNLIKNSDFRYGIDKWVPTGVAVSVEGDSTFETYLKMVSTAVGSSEQRLYPSTTENFIHTSGTYALSFYAKADSATSMQTNIAGDADTGINHMLTTEWQRFTRVYNASGGSITFWPNEANTTIYLTKVKIEIGDKSTDWTPAVEDMATSEDVEKAQSSADNAQEKANEAKALIAQLADSISTLVTDGNGTSLMTQTEDGWTFSTAEIQSIVNATSEGLDSLTNELDNTNNVVDILKQAVVDLGTISEYVGIGTYEGEPSIELGESDSDFKLIITNTRIMFMEGSSIPAYINNQSLHITKAVIEEEIQQGEFIWKVRQNGNMGLMWKGEV